MVVLASESSPGHHGSLSEWTWWSADYFLGHRFSVEIVAGMMILRAAMVGVCFAWVLLLHRFTCAGAAVSFTSPPGGNKVDGLPPASSTGARYG